MTETHEPGVAKYEPWPCSKCGYVTDAAEQMGGKSLPDEGDIGLCLNCGTLHQIKGGKFLPLTDDEFLDLPLGMKNEINRVEAARKAVIKTDLRKPK